MKMTKKKGPRILSSGTHSVYSCLDHFQLCESHKSVGKKNMLSLVDEMSNVLIEYKLQKLFQDFADDRQ